MPIITGTVTVTQNSKIVTGVGTTFLTEGVSASHRFKLNGDPTFYDIAVAASSETSLTLLQSFAGIDQSTVSYQIFNDFEPPYNLIRITPDTKDTAYVYTENLRLLSDALADAGASTENDQNIARIHVGEAILDREWAFIKFTTDATIKKLRLRTDDVAPNGSLILDMAIDGTYQSVNLTVPASNLSVESAALTNTVDAGEWVKFKWTQVPAIPGQNWYLDITYKSSPALVQRYDFVGIVLGDLSVSRIIGNGFKPPVKSKLFGLHYEFAEFAPQGQAVIVEVLKNGASLGTPVTFTLPAGTLWDYLECTQTTFETTNTMTFIINQIGSTIPGSGLIITPHTYRIE